MIRVAVCGKTPQSTSEMKHTLKVLGAKNVHENPEYVIAWGGDGTLLIAERQYPGVPKLHIRDKSICEKCVDGKAPAVLAKFLAKKFKVNEIIFYFWYPNFCWAFFAVIDKAVHSANISVHRCLTAISNR